MYVAVTSVICSCNTYIAELPILEQNKIKASDLDIFSFTVLYQQTGIYQIWIVPIFNSRPVPDDFDGYIFTGVTRTDTYAGGYPLNAYQRIRFGWLDVNTHPGFYGDRKQQ